MSTLLPLDMLRSGEWADVAEVTGEPTLVDPAPFRLSRFTDGSNPRPHPLAS